MVAFVATLGELFRMKRNQQHTDDFNAEKRKMRIPLYQREYTWPEERISALILDIISRDKFLGNIILDELDDHYEIADGQQRITTCLLILAELFNRYSGSPYEQASIRAYLTAQNGEIVLKNDSIGEYLIENAGRYDLTIDDANDVFSQKKTFEAAKEIISSTLSEHLSSDEDIRQFKSKLLDCNFLVLINNRQENRTPIEQVFLDINEKAQLLAPEDIFKGHCFERYTDDYYDELRNTWIELKKQAGSFIRFGIKNLSEYLYLYILEATDADINNSIAVGGKHYLDSKNMDEINLLLQDMISFGKAASELCDNINNTEYRFEDICPNSRQFRTTGDHLILKLMFREMLLNSSATYQKLPVLYLLFKLSNDSDLRNMLTHDNFRRIVTNLFVYNAAFAYLGEQKKSKKLIDHSLRDAICSQNRTAQRIIDAAKALRTKELEDLKINNGERRPVLYFVASVIDFYNSQDNWMGKMYYDSPQCEYNLEHLVIPNNRRRLIKWVSDNNSFDIELPKNIVSAFKKTQSNFVILNRELNEAIEHNDIVDKIATIRKWYADRAQNIPNHLQLYIGHIESCERYEQLVDLKERQATKEEVEPAYLSFLKDYFSIEQQDQIKRDVEAAFANAFEN